MGCSCFVESGMCLLFTETRSAGRVFNFVIAQNGTPTCPLLWMSGGGQGDTVRLWGGPVAAESFSRGLYGLLVTAAE